MELVPPWVTDRLQKDNKEGRPSEPCVCPGGAQGLGLYGTAQGQVLGQMQPTAPPLLHRPQGPSQAGCVAKQLASRSTQVLAALPGQPSSFSRAGRRGKEGTAGPPAGQAWVLVCGTSCPQGGSSHGHAWLDDTELDRLCLAVFATFLPSPALSSHFVEKADTPPCCLGSS